MAYQWVKKAQETSVAVRFWWLNRQLDHLAWRIALRGNRGLKIK